MNCRECGLPQCDDAIFCEDCGAKLPDREPEPAGTVFPPHIYGVKKPVKKSATAYILLFLTSMCIFSAVVILFVNSLYGNSDGDGTDTITKAVSHGASPTAEAASHADPVILNAVASLLASPDTMEPILVQSAFYAASPQIYVTFTVKDAAAGQLVKVDLTYGDASMNVWAAVSDGSLQKMQCSFIKPAAGWQVGVYEVKISVGGEYSGKIVFSIN